MQPIAATRTQEAVVSKEPQNKGKYLAFASSADFEAAIKALAVADPNESETARLEKWEKKYNFHSLRAEYARKKKEKEDKALAGAGTLRVPDGEDPYPAPTPVFQPYEEPWDEGLIIEDDVFAAMVSPDGTVQIDGDIFRIDLVNNIVSYIPATPTVSTKTTYNQFIVASPTVVNNEIRYFNMDENVLELLDAGDTGTAFGYLRIGGIGCGPGADWGKDAAFVNFTERQRLDCKIAYQKLGIYFSIVAKAHYQTKRWYGLWVGTPVYLRLAAAPAVFYEPKCNGIVKSDYGSYTNAIFLNIRENGNENTVKKRFYAESKGLKRYKAEVRFGFPDTNAYTRVFRIESKW